MDSRIGTNAERPTKGDSLTSDEQCSPTSLPAIDKFAIRGTDSNQIIFDEALLKSPGNLTEIGSAGQNVRSAMPNRQRRNQGRWPCELFGKSGLDFSQTNFIDAVQRLVSRLFLALVRGVRAGPCDSGGAVALGRNLDGRRVVCHRQRTR